eukprot:935539-Pyramimonas_sp.AAC.1
MDESVGAGPEHAISSVLLWDIGAFYDSLEFDRLFEQGLEKQFPPQVLVLEGLAHLTSRTFRENRSFSEPVQPTKSIIAGARRGLDFG